MNCSRCEIDARLAGLRGSPVANRVFEIDQQARLVPSSASSTSTLPWPSKGWKRSRITSTTASSSGWPGREQFRLRLTVDERLLERDPRVAIEHGIAAADQPVAMLSGRRERG